MIALDSNVLIYVLERNETFFVAAEKALLQALNAAGGACVSNLVITEVVAGKGPGADLGILSHPKCLVSPVTNDIAHQAGVLRLEHGIKTPDAIHIATALVAGAERFITNDKALIRLQIPGLSIKPLA